MLPRRKSLASSSWFGKHTFLAEGSQGPCLIAGYETHTDFIG